MSEMEELREEIQIVDEQPDDNLSLDLAETLAPRRQSEDGWFEIPTARFPIGRRVEGIWMSLTVLVGIKTMHLWGPWFKHVLPPSLWGRVDTFENLYLSRLSIYTVVICSLLLIWSAIELLRAGRRKKLFLSEDTLKIRGSKSEDVIHIDKIHYFLHENDGSHTLQLADESTVTLPKLARAGEEGDPLDILLNWLREGEVWTWNSKLDEKLADQTRIPLPQLRISRGWAVGLWASACALVLPLLVNLGHYVVGADPRSLPEHWSMRLLIISVFGLAALAFGVRPALAARQKKHRFYLQFTDGGLVTERGAQDPDFDLSTFRRFLVEYRREWWGLTRKRLCAETHYGRRIPLTGYCLNWPLEAEQILHQAGERGIPVVLRKEGDEEPLEIP